MAKYLGRQQILDARDIQTETVHVPEWGGDVLVRGLTGAERDEFEDASMRGRGKNREVNLRNFRARLVVRSVVDEKGNRVFGDDDVAALGSKSAAALQRIFDAASKLSGLSNEDIEDLTKNSDDGQSGDSGSA